MLLDEAIRLVTKEAHYYAALDSMNMDALYAVLNGATEWNTKADSLRARIIELESEVEARGAKMSDMDDEIQYLRRGNL